MVVVLLVVVMNVCLLRMMWFDGSISSSVLGDLCMVSSVVIVMVGVVLWLIGLSMIDDGVMLI